jgi:NAD(P)H-dependent flavin oxidoreductase YrpB (nitropropane dioxygenase family)
MLRTRFTDLVGCTVPIQQAGMGSLSNPRLARAVADAGGLGSVAVYAPPTDLVGGILDDLAEHTPGVFGGNVITRFVTPDRLHELIATTAQRSRVVDFFYSDPDPALIEIVHAHGALACWQVGSREEAIAAVAAGCDFIIAQGIEAGGHVRGTIGLLALLDEVLGAVDVPVLAAGGIGSGRTMAAALAAGADGVRIGTRLVAAAESEAHPTYVQALIAARPVDTVYDDSFHVGWPEPAAPGRLLRSSVAAAAAFDGEIVGEAMGPYTGKANPVRRWGISTVGTTHSGAIEAMSLWAGESVSGVSRVQPAGEIIREMAEEAERLLRRWR